MAERVLHLDYETRSLVDLWNEGAYRYTTGDTEIICLGWAFDDDEPKLWVPGKPFPNEILEHWIQAEPRSTHAHNAQFERLITKYVLWPAEEIKFDFPDLDHWYCTAAQARARALPGALEDLGTCLGVPFRKDKRGKELIKLLCIPTLDEGGGKSFNRDPELLAEMYAYCMRDVEVERVAAKMTPPLTDDEFAVFVASEVVNDAGLKVDVEFAAAAGNYADLEIAEISAELVRVSRGKITSPQQYQRLKDYMVPLAADDDGVRKAMTVVKTDRRTGEEERKITLDKDARRKILQLEEETPGRIPEDIVELVGLIDDAGRSSVHKFNNMVSRAGADGRVRGAYMFSGAGQTGRFSSVGLQVHNFPRTCAEDPEEVRELVIGDYEFPDVMGTLASMLRPSIIADDGHAFVCGDWSSIEARVLPWLAEGTNTYGEDVLEVYRHTDAYPDDPDPYMHAAGDIFGLAPGDVTPDQRAVGKVAVLACGYQGGYRAFQSMARAYGVVMDDTTATEIVYRWRAENPWAKAMWRGLEFCAVSAVRKPGVPFDYGRLTYTMPAPGAPLYCELPSGRFLSYPAPRIEVEETEHDHRDGLSVIKAQWKPRQGEEEWPRVDLYGGLLAENATQAAAADILRGALVDLVEYDWPVVGHTHDELLLEVEKDEVVETMKVLGETMADVPTWATGLPLACEIWTGKRYRK